MFPLEAGSPHRDFSVKATKAQNPSPSSSNCDTPPRMEPSPFPFLPPSFPFLSSLFLTIFGSPTLSGRLYRKTLVTVTLLLMSPSPPQFRGMRLQLPRPNCWYRLWAPHNHAIHVHGALVAALKRQRHLVFSPRLPRAVLCCLCVPSN
ncbi:exo-alpha-sialidase, partial [Trypanosoma cruzi]